MKSLLFSLSLLLFTTWAAAQVPQLLNYQGRVAVGTVNFEGTGQFRFALVNAAGTTIYWGNAADTAPADGVPDAAVSLTVSKGLYSVLLGDTTIANMTAIPASVWTNADVRLRVWFDDGANGSQLLSPDQRLAPNGYLPDGSVTAAAIADGAVSSAKMAAGSVTNTQLGANAVQSANIAAGAVSSSQIATGAVTNAQMAAGAITGANLATQSRSGTMLDGVLNFSTPGSVSVPIVFSPVLNASPTLSQSPGGWTLSAGSSAGFTASAPFTPVIVDSAGDVGQNTTVVQTPSGRPAISYHDITSGTVKFAIAANPDGSGGWTTVSVDTANTSTPFSMAMLGGVPCIAYRKAPGDDLAFARASSADGSGIWTITVVDSVGNVGAHCSLQEVSGRPAISYRDQTQQELKYAIAPNADGTGMWAVVTVDSAGNTGTYTSLAVINGTPAISYVDSTNVDLKYVRATDATGGAWGSPMTLDSIGSVGSFSSLRVVNGTPAISYYDDTNDDLKYVRASNADGSAWSAPVTVDFTGNVGQFTSLAVLNGRPAISYFGATTQDLKLAYASTADGSGTWTSLVMDAGGNVGRYASLAQMGGGLAISYYDTNNQDLKYAAIPALNWAASEFGTAGPIAATSFSGDGAALTNLNGANMAAGTVGSAQLAAGATAPPVSIAGTTQAAVANASYLATNASPTTINLPATANVGDVIRITASGAGGWEARGGNLPVWVPRLGAGDRLWNAMASSADGSKLVAVAEDSPICTSADFGVTWTTREASRGWISVASSADGSKLVALDRAGGSGGLIYTSTDFGVTWTPRSGAGSRDWRTVASSPNGNLLVALGVGTHIYTSTDFGATWTARESVRDWQSVASSADGSKLVVGVYGGKIYTSADAGVSWTERMSDADRFWVTAASSADGSKLVMLEGGSDSFGQIYTSTDFGVTWTAREESRHWSGIASSADGTRLLATVYGGLIYLSVDSGVTWAPMDEARTWIGAASSADGGRLAVLDHWGPSLSGGLIHTASVGVLPVASGAQGTHATLQYLGDGEWAPVAQSQIASGAVGGSQLASNLTLGGTTTGTFSGNGSGLTSLSGANMTAGSVGSAQLASNLTLGGTTTGTFSGNLTGNASTATTATSSGSATTAGSATNFTGALAGDVTGTQSATSIAAATVTGKQLTGFSSTTGTITASDTVLSAISKLNGNVALKAPLASPTFTGTVSATTFSGSGSGLTALNASNLSAGTVGDARLSTNVAMRNAANSFTATQTLAAGTTTLAPLKLQTGVNLTTPQFGAVEFDGTNLYLTNNSGTPTRKTVAFTDSAITGLQIANETITGSMLADGTVTLSKLGGDVGLWGTGGGNYFLPAGSVGIGTSTPAGALEISRVGQSAQVFSTSYSSNFVPMYIGRRAGGTDTSPLAVQSAQVLAVFSGRGHNGTAFAGAALQDNASISMVAAENFSPTAHGTSMQFFTTPTGTTSALEQMRITAGGNLGLGTASPAGAFEVSRDGLSAQVYATCFTDSQVPMFIGRRARGTLAAPTPVLSNNALAIFSGRGHNGSAFPGSSILANASIGMYAAEDFTPTAQGTNIRFHTTPVTTDTAVEQMRIQANGNVGIGTVNPAADLEVARSGSTTSVVATSYGNFALFTARTALGTSAAPAAVIANTPLAMFGGRGHTGSAFGTSTATASNASITMHAAQNFTPTANGTDIRFWTTPIGSISTVEAMRITPAGRVGIGTIPDAALHVTTQSAGSQNNTAAFSAPNIGPQQSHIHYGTTGNWIIRSASAAGAIIMQDSGGSVGIGTSSPTQAKLVVDGGINNPGFTASYMQLGGGSFSAIGHGAHSISIYATGAIMSNDGLYVTSDARIKTIEGVSDGKTDLDTLLGIEITDYHFRDTVAKGSSKHKKVIAQQVEKVFPQAISQHTNVVPDIFKRAEIEDGWVMLATDLKKAERVRIMSGKDNDAIHEVLEVRKDRFRTSLMPQGRQVFIYGREVKDFRAVDYDAIAMLNVSATQELAKKLAAKEAEIARIAAENAEMKQQLAAQAKRDNTIEARLAAIEKAAAAPGAQPVKIALKK